MRVLVIPEDPTHDEQILKPVVERVFRELGRPRAHVQVLKDPCMRGVQQALASETVDEILGTYRMADLFLLIVDRDCEVGRHGAVASRESQAAQRDKTLIGCLAVEEVEVWALALHADELSQRWSDVRKECHPKERFFDPLVESKGWGLSKGKGRSAAMAALAGQWKALKQRCPEVRRLEEAVAAWLEGC